MRVLTRCLVIVAFSGFLLSGCAPKPLSTSDLWQAFVTQPTANHFDAVYAVVQTCQQPACPAMSEISGAMVAALAARVHDKNPYAVRLGLAMTHALRSNTAGADDLAHSFGPVVDDQPQLFLSLALQENAHDTALATLTPGDLSDNDTLRYNEMYKRRVALLSVTDARLVPLRDEYVAALDKRMKAIAPSVLHLPLFPPVS